MHVWVVAMSICGIIASLSFQEALDELLIVIAFKLFRKLCKFYLLADLLELELTYKQVDS